MSTVHLCRNTILFFYTVIHIQLLYWCNIWCWFLFWWSGQKSWLVCFFQLKIIFTIRSFSWIPDLQKLVHAFIYSWLDYCSALDSGFSHSLHQLQLVQFAAAGLITERRDHTPVLAPLHWLPVRFRIDFKMLLLTLKDLNCLAPKYISDLLTWYVPPYLICRWSLAGYSQVTVCAKVFVS